MNIGIIYNPFTIVVLLYALSSVWQIGRLTRPDRYDKGWAELLPLAAFTLHTAFVVLLTVKAGNIPITNLYESVVLLTWCVVGVFLTV
ncbi:MAG: hypothetical protein GY800_08845, partial [Planctomycetes bacterium]|nr:hypothetical protein [Planctomycetota bacterium]